MYWTTQTVIPAIAPPAPPIVIPCHISFIYNFIIFLNSEIGRFEIIRPIFKFASREAHRGDTVRYRRSIKGHDDVDRTREAGTPPCFLSRGSSRLPRGSSRLLLQIPSCLLCLFVHILFPTLVLILLAFVSHCVPPFPVVRHLLAASVPLRRQFCLCLLSWVFLLGQRIVGSINTANDWVR